ncbi:uncharacterized protein V6R79_003394 [Siganus canaliculatus]
MSPRLCSFCYLQTEERGTTAAELMSATFRKRCSDAGDGEKTGSETEQKQRVRAEDAKMASNPVTQEKSTSTRVYQSPSESTRVHQSPPESTRVHQSPPESTRVHQSPPESIRVHQSPSESTRVHQSPPESTRVYQSPSESTRVHQSPPESIRVHQSPPESTRVHQSPPESTRVLLWPLLISACESFSREMKDASFTHESVFSGIEGNVRAASEASQIKVNTAAAASERAEDGVDAGG